jgi:hypothetical protein
MKNTTFGGHTRVGDVKSTGTTGGWWPDFNCEVTLALKNSMLAVAYPGIFFRGGLQIQLRTGGILNGDLGAVEP